MAFSALSDEGWKMVADGTKSDNDELCYLDENGVKQDAALHNAILDNPDAEAVVIAQTRKRLKAQGLSDQVLDVLYGTYTA